MPKRDPFTAIIGIYKIVSPSAKVYIGQSWDIKERWGSYRRREHPSQRVLHRSLMKYGSEAHVFEVIHRLPPDTSQSIMNRLEQFHIERYRAMGFRLLNCREGGSNGKLSDETRRRVSASLKGNTPWNKGKKGLVKHSVETREKMRRLRIGRKPNNYGKPRSQSAIEATRRGNTGQRRTPEQIAAMKAIWATHPPSMGGRKNKGRKHTPEHRQRLRESLQKSGAGKGERHNNAKITEAVVREIRSKFIPRKYTSRRLASEYGLSKTNILDIVNRKIWVNV